MKSHTDMEVLSGSRGSRKLALGAHTGLRFKSFRASGSGVTVSVLKATKDATDNRASGDDVLSAHYGAALEPADLIICQNDVFTDITCAVDGITIYF